MNKCCADKENAYLRVLRNELRTRTAVQTLVKAKWKRGECTKEHFMTVHKRADSEKRLLQTLWAKMQSHAHMANDMRNGSEL